MYGSSDSRAWNRWKRIFLVSNGANGAPRSPLSPVSCKTKREWKTARSNTVWRTRFTTRVQKWGKKISSGFSTTASAWRYSGVAARVILGVHPPPPTHTHTHTHRRGCRYIIIYMFLSSEIGPCMSTENLKPKPAKYCFAYAYSRTVVSAQKRGCSRLIIARWNAKRFRHRQHPAHGRRTWIHRAQIYPTTTTIIGVGLRASTGRRTPLTAVNLMAEAKSTWRSTRN
jgi:hypothetical protein